MFTELFRAATHAEGGSSAAECAPSAVTCTLSLFSLEIEFNFILFSNFDFIVNYDLYLMICNDDL